MMEGEIMKIVNDSMCTVYKFDNRRDFKKFVNDLKDRGVNEDGYEVNRKGLSVTLFKLLL